MTVRIELPEEQAAALNAKAAAQGLTLEDWFRVLAAQEASAADGRRVAQAAAARILEIQKRVKPDPEGWTIRDYIDQGRQ
jgi:plasmid stability protein